jgi:hypothetical protein
MQVYIKDGKTTWKPMWAEIGGKRKYYRSRWEFRYALYLDFMKKHGHILEWEHEPETFWFEGIKRGTNNYKPDFKVQFPSGNVEYHEVKGHETAKDLVKYKRMKKYHPSVVLRVVKGDWFKTNGKMLKAVLPDW